MSTESHNDETVSTAEDRKEAAGSSAEDHKNETVSGVEERKAETGSTVKDDNYDYNSVARDSFLNSLKHGAFSRRVLLPGESHEEFDAIYKSMKEELNPQGPVEEEKVQTIVRNLWRKRQRDRYRRAKAESVKDQLWRKDRDIDLLVQFVEDVSAGQTSKLRLPKRIEEIFKVFPAKRTSRDPRAGNLDLC